MRVLHILSSYGENVKKGGVATAAGLLARAQVRLGAQVTVCSTGVELGSNRANPEHETHGGVSIYCFPSLKGFQSFFCSPLFRTFLGRIKQFDIAHIHGLWNVFGTWGAIASRRANVPYIVSPQGMLNEWAIRFRAYKKMPYWYAIERRTIRRAAWIHFATQEEQRQARPWIGMKKTKVIPIGLNRKKLDALPLSGEFRDRQRIPAGIPLLAFVGRIHPIKGLDVLFQALARVKTEVPGVVLAIAGPDEDGHRGRLQALAQRLGVHERVYWLGMIEEQVKYRLLVDADLFVLPSFSENFGLAAVEAMAVGCPVILGTGVNIAPQVQAYGAGWVVPTEPEALSSVIVAALRDSDARQAAGKAGQRLVAECYDGETVAREMLKAYQECLG